MKDLYNRLTVSRGISPVSGAGDNTAQVSQIIDRQGYEGVMFAILLGSIADADATFAVTMDDGDDSGLSDAAAVSATDLLGTYAGAGFQFDSDNGTRKIGYKGNKRYVRLTITPSANTGAWLVGVGAILGYPNQQPTP
jgi:hypothetical protein